MLLSRKAATRFSHARIGETKLPSVRAILIPARIHQRCNYSAATRLLAGPIGRDLEFVVLNHAVHIAEDDEATVAEDLPAFAGRRERNSEADRNGDSAKSGGTTGELRSEAIVFGGTDALRLAWPRRQSDQHRKKIGRPMKAVLLRIHRSVSVMSILRRPLVRPAWMPTERLSVTASRGFDHQLR